MNNEQCEKIISVAKRIEEAFRLLEENSSWQYENARAKAALIEAIEIIDDLINEKLEEEQDAKIINFKLIKND